MNFGSVFVQAAVSWSPDSRRIACAKLNIVSIWNINDKKLSHLYKGHQNLVDYTTWSPDGNYVISTELDHIHIWDPLGNDPAFIYPPHDPDLTEDQIIKQIYNMENSDQYIQIDHSPYIILWRKYDLKGVLYRPYIPRTLQIWDTKSARFVRAAANAGGWYAGNGFWTTWEVWSLNGKRQLVPEKSANVVLVHDIPSSRDIAKYSGMFPVAWSPDDKYIAIEDVDGSINVWQAP